MFAGGHGGNRIKCRIVHHDPVRGFRFGFALGLGIRFGMSPSRNHVPHGAPYCRRNATTGRETELSTSAADLKFLEFRRTLSRSGIWGF
jgi:hypothetical protein